MSDASRRSLPTAPLVFEPRATFLPPVDVLKAVRALKASAGRAADGLSRVSSLWVAVALIVLMVLQAPSGTGGALEKLGADVVSGWLVHFALLALAIDALRGVLPRAVALVPAVFYLSYGFAVYEQDIHVKLASDSFRKSNPARILDFDPSQHSLVVDHADVFAATHAIPVVYSRDASYISEGYLSYRLMEKDNARTYLGRQPAGVQVLSVERDDWPQPNLIELRIPERPPHKLVTATLHDYAGEGWKDWNIGFVSTSLSLDGQVAGQFKSGYVRRLPLFPFFTIGCSSSEQSGQRSCHADLATERIAFESRPDLVDRTLYPDPVAIMTGIRRLSPDQMLQVPGPGVGGGDETRAAPGEDAAFAALQNVISGRSSNLSWMTGALVANNPPRLAGFAAAMAGRFLDLSRAGDVDVPDRLQQLRLLAIGLVSLRPAELAAVGEELSDLAKNEKRIRDVYPLLYVRLADTGPKLYSIYRDHFLKADATQREKTLAVLAICRLGQADSELISAIGSEWTRLDSKGLHDNAYRSALFVTLLKLRQDGAVQNVHKLNPGKTRDWYEAVLAGRGGTDVGPNNCMPVEWPDDGYVPESSAPRLKWRKGHYLDGD